MNTSKTLLILFLGMFPIFKMNGQPNYSLTAHDITERKTAKLSNKAAKKSFKKGAYNKGLVHTAQALRKAEKKKSCFEGTKFFVEPLHQYNQ